MLTVTVSPKFQVVIPKKIRDALRLRPGQKMRVIEYEGRIELIPDRDISELRGFLKGIDTRLEREEDRIFSTLPLGWNIFPTGRTQNSFYLP